MSAWEPLVRELTSPPTPVDAFRALSGLPHCVFLDSAAYHDTRGSHSYVAADPFGFVQVSGSGVLWRNQSRLPGADERERHEEHGVFCPIQILESALRPLQSVRLDDLPRFQGGAAGLLSYDLAHAIETLPATRFDEFQLPAIAMGLYDVVMAFDHDQQRAWVVSQGWPEVAVDARRKRAEVRMEYVCQRLDALTDKRSDEHGRHRAKTPRIELAGTHHCVPRDDRLLSNFSAEQYRSAVQRAIDYIHAGEIFQVNLSQRLIQPAQSDSVDLYLKLRERNPAPFAGYFDLGQAQIVSASPERFLNVAGRDVETRPIKGTRQRTTQVEADLFGGAVLRHSEKDRAENVMIVDLMRNDLSRVCDPDTVRVTQLCEVEAYQYVQHLVSAVTGTLADQRTTLDLIRASFPGGSITGAPKIRAMEIIAELEPHARGAYCGSLGYLNWDGSLDLSILIRTITACHGWWQLSVGGGIVAQSDPEAELQETWHKARGML